MFSQRGADFYTAYGAGIIAARIEAYWRDRGYDRIVAERYPLAGRPGMYAVRSNIGPNGFPPS